MQKSHGTSLADLLSQHALVKVQLNAASAKPDAVGSELGEAAGKLPPLPHQNVLLVLLAAFFESGTQLLNCSLSRI